MPLLFFLTLFIAGIALLLVGGFALKIVGLTLLFGSIEYMWRVSQ